MFKKKGFSSIVAISLVILIIILTSASLSNWFSNLNNGYFNDIENDISAFEDELKIDKVIENKLYLDLGDDTINIDKVTLNGVDCNITGSYSGFNNFNLSICISSNTPLISTVSVFSNEGIFEKSLEVSYEEPSVIVIPPAPVSAFISEWDTSITGLTTSTQIQLPLRSSGTYNFFVDWGDGTNDTITTWNQAETLHTYASSGIYNITINGTIIGFGFDEAKSITADTVDDGDKLLFIHDWGDLALGDGSSHFYGAENFNILATNAPDLSYTTNFSSIFMGADSLNANLSNWDTSTITDMSRIFYDADIFNGEINGWNTSSVTTLYEAFRFTDYFNQDLDQWDTSSVTTLFRTFANANAFNGNVSTWNTSSVTNMESTFWYATSFDSPINSWDVSSVTTMYNCFGNANVFNQDLDQWVTSSLIDMERTFQSADLFNGDISTWDVSNVNTLYSTFQAATSFNQDLDQWDVSNVGLFWAAFGGATNFNGNLSGWVLTSATSAVGMFEDATSFNQDISSWDTSTLTHFGYMFRDATSFDQDISGWDVDQAINCASFDSGTSAGWTAGEKPNFLISC